MTVKTLKSARKGDVCRVVDVVSGHPLSERLLELGVQSGELVRIVHEAPFSGDPIVVDVCGTRLALRRSEAELIFVSEMTSSGKDSNS
ncbi:MAG: hypothetical protein RLZZ488_2493 [Pseudomonadota bacterium]|jgi:ferrous iron transport protein A